MCAAMYVQQIPPRQQFLIVYSKQKKDNGKTMRQLSTHFILIFIFAKKICQA